MAAEAAEAVLKTKQEEQQAWGKAKQGLEAGVGGTLFDLKLWLSLKDVISSQKRESVVTTDLVSTRL